MKVEKIFKNEEILYLNSFFKNERLKKLSKDKALNQIAFAHEASDKDATPLLDGIYSTIKNLSDDEWDELKNQYPFNQELDVFDEGKGLVD